MNTSTNDTRSLDWRSLILGLLIGMMVLLASGHKSGDRFIGRYTAFSAGNSEFAIFVVDAYTGQTWRMDDSSTIEYGTPNEPRLQETDEVENNR